MNIRIGTLELRNFKHFHFAIRFSFAILKSNILRAQEDVENESKKTFFFNFVFVDDSGNIVIYGETKQM